MISLARLHASTPHGMGVRRACRCANEIELTAAHGVLNGPWHSLLRTCPGHIINTLGLSGRCAQAYHVRRCAAVSMDGRMTDGTIAAAVAGHLSDVAKTSTDAWEMYVASVPQQQGFFAFVRLRFPHAHMAHTHTHMAHTHTHERTHTHARARTTLQHTSAVRYTCGLGAAAKQTNLKAFPPPRTGHCLC